MNIFSSLLIAQAVCFAVAQPWQGVHSSDSKMTDIIETHFGNLSDAGGVAVWNGPPAMTFDQCLMLNNPQKYPFYNRTTAYNNTLNFVNSNLEKSEGLSCNGSDKTTCQAVYAARDTFLALEAAGYSPKFRNYLAAFSDANLDSVSCEPGSYDVVNKKYVAGKENGCNGFGFCDMITSILFFGANQRNTGTCGPTAGFMALAKANPPKAIQIATELMWTGTTTRFQAKGVEPCDYIYDLNPGTTDMPNSNSTLNDVCGANPSNDCKSFYEGVFIPAKKANMAPFIQSPGMEFIMTQSFGTVWFRSQTGGCSPEGFQLIKPDMSNSGEVENFQGTFPAGMMYWCELLIDPELQVCNPLFFRGQIPGLELMSQKSKDYWFSGIWRNPTSNAQITDFLSSESSQSQMTGNAKTWVDGVTCDVDPSTAADSLTASERRNAATTVFSMALVPAVDSSYFNDLCKLVNEPGQAVNLVIVADMLYGNPPKPGATCNHYVMLDSCDVEKGVANIWSWGKRYQVTPELLQGSVCSAVGAYYDANSSSAPSFFDYQPSDCGYDNSALASSPVYSLPIALLFLLFSIF